MESLLKRCMRNVHILHLYNCYHEVRDIIFQSGIERFEEIQQGLADIRPDTLKVLQELNVDEYIKFRNELTSGLFIEEETKRILQEYGAFRKDVVDRIAEIVKYIRNGHLHMYRNTVISFTDYDLPENFPILFEERSNDELYLQLTLYMKLHRHIPAFFEFPYNLKSKEDADRFVNLDIKDMLDDVILQNGSYDFWEEFVEPTSESIVGCISFILQTAKRMEWNDEVISDVASNLVCMVIKILANSSRPWNKEVVEAIERIAPHNVYREYSNQDVVIHCGAMATVFKWKGNKYVKGSLEDNIYKRYKVYSIVAS